nr:hypothetical protein SHINE37_44630 [Rhizobiaceae bacterium]
MRTFDGFCAPDGDSFKLADSFRDLFRRHLVRLFRLCAVLRAERAVIGQFDGLNTRAGRRFRIGQDLSVHSHSQRQKLAEELFRLDACDLVQDCRTLHSLVHGSRRIRNFRLASRKLAVSGLSHNFGDTSLCVGHLTAFLGHSSTCLFAFCST